MASPETGSGASRALPERLAAVAMDKHGRCPCGQLLTCAICVADAIRAALDVAKIRVCGACANGWPIDPAPEYEGAMHVIPPADRMPPTEHARGTHIVCEAWAIEAMKYASASEPDERSEEASS